MKKEPTSPGKGGGGGTYGNLIVRPVSWVGILIIHNVPMVGCATDLCLHEGGEF